MAPLDFTPAPRAWRVCDPHIRSDVPRAGGCYAIFVDGELVYIGQTQNLWTRLKSYNIRHDYGDGYFTPWGSCLGVVVKIKVGKRFGEWAMREQRLIRRLRPKHNSRIG